MTREGWAPLRPGGWSQGRPAIRVPEPSLDLKQDDHRVTSGAGHRSRAHRVKTVAGYLGTKSDCGRASGTRGAPARSVRYGARKRAATLLGGRAVDARQAPHGPVGVDRQEPLAVAGRARGRAARPVWQRRDAVGGDPTTVLGGPPCDRTGAERFHPGASTACPQAP